MDDFENRDTVIDGQSISVKNEAHVSSKPQSARQEVVYQTNRDRYVGDIDPKTKLRNGQGCYTYTNPYFQYQGVWNNGVKDKEGTLLMRDGGSYQGEIKNGEINGNGRRKLDDGTEYHGEFVMGEKHGYGEIIYGQRNWKEESYKGEWNMNVRSGFGQLKLRNGIHFSGNFINNQPNGDVTISYPDGSMYRG